MSLDGQGAANRVSSVVGKNSPLDLLSDPHRRLLQSEARLRADEGLAYGLNCPDSSDPLTSHRFADRSQKRKRQKLLIRRDHLVAFTLAG